MGFKTQNNKSVGNYLFLVGFRKCACGGGGYDVDVEGEVDGALVPRQHRQPPRQPGEGGGGQAEDDDDHVEFEEDNENKDCGDDDGNDLGSSLLGMTGSSLGA